MVILAYIAYVRIYWHIQKTLTCHIDTGLPYTRWNILLNIVEYFARRGYKAYKVKIIELAICKAQAHMKNIWASLIAVHHITFDIQCPGYVKFNVIQISKSKFLLRGGGGSNEDLTMNMGKGDSLGFWLKATFELVLWWVEVIHF